GAAVRARRDAVRRGGARLEVPGPAGAHAVALLAELCGRVDHVILVTGGSGFVGGHVVAALRADGRDDRCFVRDLARGKHLEEVGCTLVEGDVTRPDSLRPAVEGCDTAVHLVAIRHGHPEEFRQAMIGGTRSLIDPAEEAGVGRIVLMSALRVTAETKDLVPYYHAKWEMEGDVKAAGIPYVVFRPSFIFGREGGILPTFIKLARLAPVTPIIGSGTQRIQPIWADDIGAYFARAVDLQAATDQTFEVGGPDAVSC